MKNLSSIVSFTPGNEDYQAIYSSQLYGTFFIIYAQLTTSEDDDNYYLHAAKLHLVNYKGPFDMGITRAICEPALDGDANQRGVKFRIEVQAMHQSSEAELEVHGCPGEDTPISKVGSYLLVDRRLKRMHEDQQGTNLPTVMKNGIFDEEFFYRDGPADIIKPRKKDPAPKEWGDTVIFTVSRVSGRCPRAQNEVK